jgi:hypothetical protein
MHTATTPPEEALDRLERNLALWRPESDFPPPREAAATVGELRRELIECLVRRRPELEARGLLDRPYRLLARAGAELDPVLAKNPDSSALLPAALLPVPGQWARLNELQQSVPPAAVQDFLAREAERIADKRAKKLHAALAKGKTHKPWNFLQVVKPPVSDSEKGVLRVFAMPYLLADPATVRALGREWTLLVEPAAGVSLRHDWMRAFLHAEAPPVFGVAGTEDARFLETQGARTVPLAHSDYLPAEKDVPLGGPKRFDLLFIGLYDEMDRKRHGLLLDLLRSPELASATALVLGRGSDQALARFQAMAAERGVAERVTALANVPRPEVPELIDACRLSLNLSLHENGCRAITECLRSNVPMVVSACTAGVNFEQINADTGIAASDPDLPAAVADALSRAGSFRPREWFLAHLGAENSSSRLNRLLHKLYSRMGMDWTADVLPLTSSGAHRHLHEKDLRRMLPHYRRIQETLEASPGFNLPLESPRP